METERFARRAVPLGILGLKVTQRGEELAYRMWDIECRRNVYSVSKSFTSCAVGIAVKEGLLALDEKLTDAFAEDLPETADENLAKATVRDLLTMCLGQESEHFMGGQRYTYEEDDWVKKALAISFVNEPGTKFVYSNVGPYLAGILLQRRCGCDLVSYLMPRLFRPLGIKLPTWEVDPLGNTFGASGLFLTLSEIHKFGLLYLNEGRWNGKQIVPEEWVRESGKQQAGDFPYGYLFWLGDKNSYRADGLYAQFSIILPEKEAVISVVSECRDADAMQKAIFEELYPQL